MRPLLSPLRGWLPFVSLPGASPLAISYQPFGPVVGRLLCEKQSAMLADYFCCCNYIFKKEKGFMDEKDLPKYETPKIDSYTDDELMNILGPAQTGSDNTNVLVPDGFGGYIWVPANLL